MKKIFFAFFILLISTNITLAGEGLNKYILNNGQNVIIKEVHTNPIVTVDTWIKTGSINEDDSNNGVSHFLEHLFFRGSKNHAPGEFDQLLETKGAVTNAATSKDYTHYYITIPSKFFDDAIELHSDMLLNPLLPRKELEKERKVVIEEIAKDENSPQHVVYDNLVSMIYSTHPYKRKVIGKKEIVDNIPREKIMEYYNRWYLPSNMTTVIVGDVNSSDALEKVKKHFGSNINKTQKSSYPKEKPLNQQKRKIAHLDSQSGYMLIGFRGVNINNPDSYALDVLAAILGDGKSSVFYKNIKDKLQLAFSISASNSGFRDDGIFYISANFTPEKLNKLEDEIFKEISYIQNYGVTPEQVSLAKNVIERDTYYERESVSNIAQEIGYVMTVSGNICVYEDYVKNIKKVTPEQVKRAAIKYLGKEKSAVSIVLPNSSGEVKASVTTKSSYIEPKLVSQNNGTSEYELSNGATVLLTPNTSNEIVGITIFAKGGNFLEPKYGISNMTASSMLKGTTNYSATELARILEDNGIKIVPSTKSDAFVVSVLTTSNQYDKTLELISEVLNNSTFPDSEIDKVKKEKLNTIKKSRDIPLNLAIEGYKDLIFENTPYTNSTILLEKNIPQITSQDIKNYYGKIFEPKNIVISINGNVPKEKTFEAFSNMLTTKNNPEFSYSQKSGTIKPLTSIKQRIKQTSATNTDWILLGWQVAGLENKKDYAALQVIDSILGTGLSSRLFKNLRDQEGLAYQLGSSYSANALGGAFLLYIGTNPETYEKSLNGLKNEIQALKTVYVGSKELQEAKDKLIGHFILSLETNMDKASTLGWFQTSGNGYRFVNEYEKLINSVTESDIMRVANKYFKDNAYILSVVKK